MSQANSPRRMRTPPRQRFASSVDEIDLSRAVEILRSEPNSGQHGHRQMALFHHGRATLALYCFEAGSTLPDHVAEAVEFIQVLAGRLTVATDEHDHELPAGSVLRLAAGVRHDFTATVPSDVLWTVCLENAQT